MFIETSYVPLPSQCVYNIYIVTLKVVMLGKLILVAYTTRVQIETSSLWAEFVNKNR